MQKIKWAFIGYVSFCLLLAAGFAVSFSFTRVRDPQTLYGTYGGKLKSLDPAEIGDAGAANLSGHVYETLYNYAYGEDKYRLIPELADGEPNISADGKTIVIRIKPGVHFFDATKQVFPDGQGPEVTAEDFVYSWKRVGNFHIGFTANFGQLFQGRIVGIDDWFEYTKSCKTPADIDWSRPVEGLKALDRYTLQIKLIDPFPQLLYNLAMLPAAVVSRDAVDYWKDRFKHRMVGTGAYGMSEHLPDQQIVFVANPFYRGGPDVKSGTPIADADKLPYVKRVQLNCFDETLPPWYLFLSGQLDANSIPKDTFGQAIAAGTGNLTPAMENDGIRLIKYKNPQISYVVFNLNDPVLGKNKPLRQAMSLAFDRQRYIDLYLNGRGVPANGPIPPGFPTYDPKRFAQYCQFNLDAAKEKMKEAIALNDGKPIPPIRILFGNTDSSANQQADFMTTAMKQIGVQLVADFKPYGVFLTMLDRDQTQMYSLGWVADYPDEQNYWQLFYGKNAGGGGLNGSRYRNPAFDALYERSSVLGPGPERDELYRQMQDMVLDDCPMIFNVYPITYQLYHDWMATPWISDYGHGYRAYSKIDFAARANWLNQH
ncbi:MAG: ABC transporter substrate-binding protein [Tepidisphaeraceae bacterium]